MPAPPPQIGPYTLLRELGRGGMGIVYEVSHPDVPRRLALKVVSTTLAGPEGLARFSREMDLLARVRHPSVVAVHAVGRTPEGHPYLVTDLVEGESLHVLAKRAPFGPKRAAAIVKALCEAVEALHAQGIVHRDLKPDNVILTANDTPVLLDFGIARELDAKTLTQSGAVVGTPAYMAPEQASGEGQVDARTDVYGLGSILFELLAGRPPYLGPPLQVLTMVLLSKPKWPSGAAIIPPALDALVRRAMAKDPLHRPPSAAAFAEQLERFLRGELPPPPRAVPVVPIVAVVVLALVAGGVFASTRRGADPAPPAPPPPAPPPPPKPAPPPPPFDVGNPVVSYRKVVAWLRQNRGHARREQTAATIAPYRAWQRPLAELSHTPAADEPNHPFRIKFATDALLLATIQLNRNLVLDVERRRELPPLALPAHNWTRAVEARRLADGTIRIATSSNAVLHTGAVTEEALRTGRAELAGRLVTLPKIVTRPGEETRIDALAFSPDGNRLAIGGDFACVEVESFDGTPPVRLPGVASRVAALAFSPDGATVFAGTWVNQAGGGGDAFFYEWGRDGALRPYEPFPARMIASIATLERGAVAAAGGLFRIRDGKRERLGEGLGFNNVAAGAGVIYATGKVPDPQLLHCLALDGRSLRSAKLEAPAASIDLSPDGLVLAVEQRERDRIVLWAAGED